MLKEIWEQPSVLQDVFRGRINHDTHELHSDTMERISALGIQKVTIVASGTSYHSGLI
jgi:glucosamine--fructose-6-phosphate aminotransferase (isomerizing)